MGLRVQGLRFGFRAVWRHADKVHVGIWYILRLQSRYMGSPSGHKYIPYTCMNRLGLIWGLQWLRQGCTVAVHAFVPYCNGQFVQFCACGCRFAQTGNQEPSTSCGPHQRRRCRHLHGLFLKIGPRLDCAEPLVYVKRCHLRAGTRILACRSTPNFMPKKLVSAAPPEPQTLKMYIGLRVRA